MSDTLPPKVPLSLEDVKALLELLQREQRARQQAEREREEARLHDRVHYAEATMLVGQNADLRALLARCREALKHLSTGWWPEPYDLLLADIDAALKDSATTRDACDS